MKRSWIRRGTSRLERKRPMRDWRRKHPVGSKKRFIEDLDAVVSKIVRKRDGRCIVCGSTQELQCGHLFSRRYHATRWDLINCNVQCGNCNQLHNANRDPYTFAFIRRYGAEAHAELRDRVFSGKRFEPFELGEMLLSLQRQLKEMS